MDQLKNDISEFFSNTSEVQKVDSSYNGEYQNILIKEKYEINPKKRYPMITIDEISNEDVNDFYDGREEVSYLAYQFEITAEQSLNKTSIQNVQYIAKLLDGYLKQDRYHCLRRLGNLAKTPLSSDTNVMIGIIRYECNLEVKTNTIYRRY